MTGLPVRLRAAAEHDIEEAAGHDAEEGGVPLESRFIDSLEAAMLHIGRHPATGSPRYALELGLPGLRSWPLKRFPYLVFYAEAASHVEVWRVLHQARDVPAWLQEGDSTG